MDKSEPTNILGEADHPGRTRSVNHYDEDGESLQNLPRACQTIYNFALIVIFRLVNLIKKHIWVCVRVCVLPGISLSHTEIMLINSHVKYTHKSDKHTTSFTPIWEMCP